MNPRAMNQYRVFSAVDRKRELVSQLLTQHAGAKPVCSIETDQRKQVLW